VEQWETIERGQPRAPRFVLALPLRYRRQGEDTWEEGIMRNISRSGLLFTARQLHPISTKIELTFALPKVIGHEPPGAVRCQGDIVRTMLFAAHEDRHAIAIRIVDYEFMRTQASPARGDEAGERC
jgi:hypothetical protein